jgi:hypothetical protein
MGARNQLGKGFSYLPAMLHKLAESIPGLLNSLKIPSLLTNWKGYWFKLEPRARIFKLLRSPRIDSKEPIPPGCVAWRASTTTLFYSDPSPHRLFKIPALDAILQTRRKLHATPSMFSNTAGRT